jgi:hypothetical protein
MTFYIYNAAIATEHSTITQLHQPQNIRHLHSNSYLFAVSAVETVTRRGWHLPLLANNEPRFFLTNRADIQTAATTFNTTTNNSAISLTVYANEASLHSVIYLFFPRKSTQMSKLLTGRIRVHFIQTASRMDQPAHLPLWKILILTKI